MAQYTVDKEYYFRLISNQPAFVKKIEGLDEEMAIQVVPLSPKIYDDYIPLELKTLKVTMAYLLTNKFYRSSTLQTVPQKILKSSQFPLSFFEQYFRRRDNVPTAGLFTNMPYKGWLIAVKGGFTNINKIPSRHVTEELLLEVFKYERETTYGITIPELYWTPELCKTAVEINHKFLDIIPSRLMTREMLSLVFAAGFNITHVNIPPALWTEELAHKAVENLAFNIDEVPREFVTKDMCLKAIEAGVSILRVPIKDRDVKVAYLVFRTGKGNYSYRDEELHKLYDHDKNEEKFQLDVVRRGGLGSMRSLKHFGASISSATLEEMIKIDPHILKEIEKPQQTNKIISAFLAHASTEIIDSCASCINLSRIHKEHVPMLVGCTNRIILSIIAKKMKGSKKTVIKEEKPVSGLKLNINITPLEYSKIQGML